MDTPLNGTPDEVIDDIEQAIFEAIERDDLSQFYIGRTSSLDATQERHGSDEIIPLYEPEGPENAIEVEASLLRTFFNHPKCENESDHGDGSISREYVNFVYLAVWYR
jgi:hypothetical protein